MAKIWGEITQEIVFQDRKITWGWWSKFAQMWKADSFVNQRNYFGSKGDFVVVINLMLTECFPVPETILDALQY